MSSSRDDYASFEPQFQAALDTLVISSDTGQAAQSEPMATSTPIQGIELIGTVLKESIKFRAGPGTSYPVSGSLQNGEALLVHGRNEAGDWLSTRMDSGDEVWVFRPLVSLDDDYLELPVDLTSP